MGKALFFLAILCVAAYFIFFRNIQHKMGIDSTTPRTLENKYQNDAEN